MFKYVGVLVVGVDWFKFIEYIVIIDFMNFVDVLLLL